MSKNGNVATDANGVFIGVFQPLFTHTSMAPGVNTSVGTVTAFKDETVAVLLQPASNCWVKFGDSSNVTAATTDTPLVAGQQYTFAVKSSRYLAAIGGGIANNLKVTELG